MHYPEGQISDFQRKQLTTCTNGKIQVVLAFQGGGDDMDAPIKNILKDHDISSSPSSSSDPERLVCGVNSYDNIARPLMQMVHFVWTYLRVAESLGIEAGDPGGLDSWGCYKFAFVWNAHLSIFIFVVCFLVDLYISPL